MFDQENNLRKRKHEKDDLFSDESDKSLELQQGYITMIDVLNEQEKLEESADAVLGNSDDKNCTYNQGYVTRQALYSCRTCMGDKAGEENIFGICLACSYACHADHDLFELYTKRAFRCDCGTSKMKDRSCCIDSKPKGTINNENKYNHNFVGNYCLCDQPYPNPYGKDEEMVQCIICEDWFHEECLECSFPSDEDFAELICKNCMQKNKFLWYYQIEKFKTKISDTKAAIGVTTQTKSSNCISVNSKELSEISKINDLEKNLEIENKSQETNDLKTQVIKKEEDICCVSKDNSNTFKDEERKEQESVGEKIECKLKLLSSKINIENKDDTTFWDEGWRSQLCRCSECLSLYAENNVEFLIDETDTVHYYEAKGKEKCKEKLSQYEQGLNEISKMDHVVGIDAIIEYNKMSTEFKEHFKKFAESKKVIEQKDIEEFFATLKYKRMKSTYSF